MPARTASSRQMSKCSRVCGITDSSAATTSSTASIPPTPASMFRTNRSCPGTSTNASVDVADRGVREAEVDRDAACFLFLQTIRIDTGERAHERALAVIDVAGGADDESAHHSAGYFLRVAIAAPRRCRRLSSSRALCGPAAGSGGCLLRLRLRSARLRAARRSSSRTARGSRRAPDRSGAAPGPRGRPARALGRRAEAPCWVFSPRSDGWRSITDSSRRPCWRCAPAPRQSARSSSTNSPNAATPVT